MPNPLPAILLYSDKKPVAKKQGGIFSLDKSLQQGVVHSPRETFYLSKDRAATVSLKDRSLTRYGGDWTQRTNSSRHEHTWRSRGVSERRTKSFYETHTPLDRIQEVDSVFTGLGQIKNDIQQAEAILWQTRGFKEGMLEEFRRIKQSIQAEINHTASLGMEYVVTMQKTLSSLRRETGMEQKEAWKDLAPLSEQLVAICDVIGQIDRHCQIVHKAIGVQAAQKA